jgi:hypothetical protein
VVHPDYDEMRQLEGRFHRDQQAIRSVLSRIQGSIWSRRGKRPPSAISFHCRNTRQTSRRSSFMRAIPWDELPTVTSSELFATIKSYLLEVRKTSQLLAPAGQLFVDFARQHPEAVAEDNDLRADFDVCIGRLENRDLIRRLSFGDYVLLQPELLDAYASALVIAAKNEPDGLGSIDEETAVSPASASRINRRYTQI